MTKHLIFRTLLLLFCTAHLQAYAATPTVSPKIIGGTPAPQGTYPWITTLLYSSDPDASQAQFCGGSLIASRWVLTAAHCFDNISSASQIQVAVGIEDLSQIMSSDRVEVASIIIHPDYDAASLDNDIALLELASPVSNATVSLADNILMQGLATGDPMTIIGWGNMSTSIIRSFPDQLQEAEVFRMDFAACDSAYSTAPIPRNLTSNMICAGIPTDYNIDVCLGDSGGPMMYDNGAGTWYQTGIVSFGSLCSNITTPGVYTRVANYINWIDEITSVPLTTIRNIGYRGIGHTTTEDLTLRNYSGGDISVQSIAITGSSDFIVRNETCTTGVISNLGNCTISVNYLALVAGKQLASLAVSLDNGDTRTTQFSATGLNQIAAPALDNTNLTWFSGGDAAWFSTFESGSTGGMAMRSGAIVDNQSSVILSYITGPTTLSFRWQASTEADFDLFNFSINGTRQDTISGNTSWQQKTISLGAGEHLAIWTYEKDIVQSEQQDTVWLDSVYSITGGGGSSGSSGRSDGGGGAMNPLLLLGLLLAPLFYRRRFI